MKTTPIVLAAFLLSHSAAAAAPSLPSGWSLSEGEASSNQDGVLRLIRARVAGKKGAPERGCDVYVSRADGSQPETQALAKANRDALFLEHVSIKNERCALRDSKASSKSGIRLILSEIPLP